MSRRRIWPLSRTRYLLLHLTLITGLIGVTESSSAEAWGMRDDQDAAAPNSETLTLRVRATWGGGVPALWHGQLRLSEGEIRQTVPLGLELDAPVAHFLQDQRLLIEPWFPRTYDGVDFTLEGSPDAVLTWSFFTPGQTTAKQSGRMTLRELAAQPASTPLDDTGNRFFLQRAPGDELAVAFDRDHLVFAPEETFSLTVHPNHVPQVTSGNWNVMVSLRPGRGDTVLWEQRKNLRFNEQGSAESFDLEIPLPLAPGPYQVVIEVEGRRLVGPWVRPRSVARRSIDLVVAPAPAETEGTSANSSGERRAEQSVPTPTPWRLRHEVDPTESGWLDRIRQLDQLNVVSRFYTGRLGTREPQIESDQGVSWVKLQPGEWQAFPLSVAEAEQPHLLEVLFPAELRQQLVISLVEHPPSGTIKQWDSGVTVSPTWGLTNAAASSEPLTTTVHQVVFWPTTRTPWVVLSNPSATAPARFGVLRVFDGPTTLDDAPRLWAAPAARSVSAANDSPSRRLVGPLLEKPTLPESFWVDAWIEQQGGQPIDDWTTFDRSIRRLVAYLRYAGYNSAMLTIAADGSGWYPSDHLRPTPKYDSGVFSLEGRDPIRKDIVELLFRHFDAAGLQLIPVVDFNGPLPNLEARRRQDPSLPIDQINEAGESRLAQGLKRGRPVGFYQPLHRDVAQELQACVGEVIQRYAHHSSWNGLAIQVGPDSHWYFPSGVWGLEASLWEAFRDELIEAGVDADSITRESVAYGQWHERWLAWRSQRHLATLKEIETQLSEANPGSQLYVLGMDWFQNHELIRKFHPGVRGQDFYGQAAWAEVGFEQQALLQLEHTVIVPSQGQVTLWPPAMRRLETVLYEAPEASRFLGTLPRLGAAFHRTPATLELPEFDQLISSGRTWQSGTIHPHFSEAGVANRQRFVQALMLADRRVIFDGGWGISMGQEAMLASLNQTLAQLPNIPFATLEDLPRNETAAEVMVRTAVLDGKRWWYAVNPSPWPVELELEVDADSTETIRGLVGRVVETLESETTGTQRYRFKLEPFDLMGFVCDASAVTWKRLDGTAPEEITDRLQAELDAFANRVVQLEKQPEPLQVLSNAGFEEPATTRLIPGWTFGGEARSTGQLVARGEKAAGQALQLVSRQGVTWARSHAIPPPETGRLSMLVWLRTDSEGEQPPLRLSLDAQLTDGVYYQFAPVGSLAGEQQTQQISTQWRPFAVHFDDLPQEGIVELRVGFDLMGPGNVRIDDVRLFDRWFEQQDQRSLLQRVAAARHQLNKGDLHQPYKMLHSYWPRLLMSFPAEVAEDPETTPQEGVRSARENFNVLERVKGWVPTPRLPFR